MALRPDESWAFGDRWVSPGYEAIAQRGMENGQGAQLFHSIRVSGWPIRDLQWSISGPHN